MSESQRILIVSDNADFPRAALEQRGFAVTIANDCDTALEKLPGTSFDLLIVDFASARDGIELIRRVRATPQLAGILILIMAEWGTGEPTLALSAGADAYEPNEAASIDPSRLITSIERLLSRQAASANQQTL
jgi:two-component system alkaline phosphatase synthesis response regulator PhoP